MASSSRLTDRLWQQSGLQLLVDGDERPDVGVVSLQHPPQVRHQTGVDRPETLTANLHLYSCVDEECL